MQRFVQLKSFLHPSWFGGARKSRLFMLLAVGMMAGCQTVDSLESQEDPTLMGKLEFRANGEDFIRQGFVTKDGWDINFDHVYVTFGRMVAAELPQTELAHLDGGDLDASVAEGDSGQSAPLAYESLTDAQEVLSIQDKQTIDLAQGGADAETILVKTLDAPATHYRTLAWSLTPATAGPSQGQALQLVGQARQGETSVDFTINWDNPYFFVCGEFIGDQRKGIVKPGSKADIEATFHFDHIFGDGEIDANDPMNVKAVGFGPLAALADGATLEVNRDQLEQTLAPEEFERLQAAFLSLGHVGEGHCDAVAEEGVADRWVRTTVARSNGVSNGDLE